MRKHYLKCAKTKINVSNISYGKFLGDDFIMSKYSEVDGNDINIEKSTELYSISNPSMMSSDHLVSLLKTVTNRRGIPSLFIRKIEPFLLVKLEDFSLKNIYEIICLLKFAKTVPDNILNVLLKLVDKEIQKTTPESLDVKLVIDAFLKLVDLYREKDFPVMEATTWIDKYVDYFDIFQLLGAIKVYKRFIGKIETEKLEKLTLKVFSKPLGTFLGNRFTLNHCNVVANTLDLISLNSLHNANSKFISHLHTKEYTKKVLYPLIKENLKLFTADNITKIVESIRVIGEPYPTDILDSLSSIYIKHISQYSFEVLKVFNNSIVCRI